MPSPPAEPFLLCAPPFRPNRLTVACTEGLNRRSARVFLSRTPHAAVRSSIGSWLWRLRCRGGSAGGRPIPRRRGIRRPTGRQAACRSAERGHRMRRARATHAARTARADTAARGGVQSSDLPPRRSVRLRESRRPLIGNLERIGARLPNAQQLRTTTRLTARTRFRVVKSSVNLIRKKKNQTLISANPKPQINLTMD